MKYTNNLLLLSVLLLFVLSTNAAQCNQDDFKVLLSVKSSLGDPDTTRTWGELKACCGGWYGVGCNAAGRVTRLSIAKYNASAQIPTQVGDLPFLTSLSMYKLVNLNGPIPSTIAKLKNLESLWMSHESLSGPVPAFLSQLTKLSYLNLRVNQLTGLIPASLGSLPLSSLLLQRNRLSGPIPDSLGQLPAQFLYLSRNSLSGSIPKSFANARFEYVDLSYNKLTGDASFLFSPSSPIHTLVLSMNMLVFDLTNVKLPKNISYLDLSRNKIYGRIPSEFMNRDWSFNVSYNLLCGKIPSGMLTGSLDQTSFFHNKCLCGPPLSPCKAN